MQDKKEWTTPRLVVYGDVVEITAGTTPICKTVGSGDDLAGLISTTTGC